jgi:hypothetical protein
VIDADEDDAARHARDGEAHGVVRDVPLVQDQLAPDQPDGHRREEVVEDVERLEVPAVAHLQPLRHHQHDRDKDEQLGREHERRGDEEDDVGVVGLVAGSADDEEARDRRRRAEDEEGGPVVRVLEPAEERQRRRG